MIQLGGLVMYNILRVLHPHETGKANKDVSETYGIAESG